MPTSLGGHPQGLRLMVKNGTASVIARGTVVSWSSIAANNPAVAFLDGTQNKDYGSGTMRQIDEPYITVGLSPADGVTLGGAGRLGVAAADIPAGGFGEIITYGLARVLGGGAVTVGEVATADATGRLVDAATASHKNPIAIPLETLSTGSLGWCFVNCLNMAGCGGAAFMGKGY